jgi:hypothetical protein
MRSCIICEKEVPWIHIVYQYQEPFPICGTDSCQDIWDGLTPFERDRVVLCSRLAQAARRIEKKGV